VQRYVALSRLIPELLQMVDDGRLGLVRAVEISSLPDGEQLAGYMRLADVAGKPVKPKPFKVPRGRIERFFEPGATQEEVEETIERALEAFIQK